MNGRAEGRRRNETDAERPISAPGSVLGGARVWPPVARDGVPLLARVGIADDLQRPRGACAPARSVDGRPEHGHERRRVLRTNAVDPKPKQPRRLGFGTGGAQA